MVRYAKVSTASTTTYSVHDNLDFRCRRCSRLRVRCTQPSSLHSWALFCTCLSSHLLCIWYNSMAVCAGASRNDFIIIHMATDRWAHFNCNFLCWYDTSVKSICKCLSSRRVYAAHHASPHPFPHSSSSKRLPPRPLPIGQSPSNEGSDYCAPHPRPQRRDFHET